jgi:hypothetical protein
MPSSKGISSRHQLPEYSPQPLAMNKRVQSTANLLIPNIKLNLLNTENNNN